MSGAGNSGVRLGNFKTSNEQTEDQPETHNAMSPFQRERDHIRAHVAIRMQCPGTRTAESTDRPDLKV